MPDVDVITQSIDKKEMIFYSQILEDISAKNYNFEAKFLQTISDQKGQLSLGLKGFKETLS